MWQIDNRTPFAAERGWVRDRDGAEIWLVVVKATFDVLEDGSTCVAKDQPPVLLVPQYYGEPGRTSVKYDADVVLKKTTTDVIVVGHAYAPPGTTVTSVDVGFRVGPVHKVLRVFGNRRWKTLGMSTPEPFEKMPLVYERAYGGIDPVSRAPERDWDWRNPVGTGFATNGSHVTGLALPNVENPQHLIGSPSDRPSPAGFGVIASHWQPRASFAGTYDERWMKTRQPLLAEDMDDRFFQSAPMDQQSPDWLRGGEPVSLLRLTPSGELRFALPKIHLGFQTRFYDGTREVHADRRLHTVIFEPDFPRVSLVWHSALPCHFMVQKLEETVISLKADLSGGAMPIADAELMVV